MRMSSITIGASLAIAAVVISLSSRGETICVPLQDRALDIVRGRIIQTARSPGDPCAFNTVQDGEVTRTQCEQGQGAYLGMTCIDCGSQDIEIQGGSGIQFVSQSNCSQFSRNVGTCARNAPDYTYYCSGEAVDPDNPDCDGLYDVYVNE